MVYELIQEVADKKHLSIAQVERECGLSNGAIKKWNNAESPRLIAVWRVSKYLRIPMTKIVDEIIKQQKGEK